MKLISILFVLLFTFPSAYAQKETDFRVMWYNVENLFDTVDNPQTNDEEYLPDGDRRWTTKRYYHKLRQLAKVITAAGEWDTPALVGLCEVENDSVITHLITRTPLRRQQYHYCITSGSDQRGIQNALLYQRDKFAYLSHHSHPVRFSGKQTKLTRDLLHVCGRVISGDTLDVIVCHFPSRSGGEKETEANRLDAARTLRHLCDSLHAVRQTPQLIVMGDFNDTPTNKSIREVLQAQPLLPDKNLPTEKAVTSPATAYQKALTFYNLFANASSFKFPGSHKYQGEWSQLDQIIVSEKLIDPSHTMRLLPESITIFAPSFLLTDDKTNRGVRPKRTYYGFTYEGGYSDHLPLIADWRISAAKSK